MENVEHECKVFSFARKIELIFSQLTPDLRK